MQGAGKGALQADGVGDQRPPAGIALGEQVEGLVDGQGYADGLDDRLEDGRVIVPGVVHRYSPVRRFFVLQQDRNAGRHPRRRRGSCAAG